MFAKPPAVSPQAQGRQSRQKCRVCTAEWTKIQLRAFLEPKRANTEPTCLLNPGDVCVLDTYDKVDIGFKWRIPVTRGQYMVQSAPRCILPHFIKVIEDLSPSKKSR